MRQKNEPMTKTRNVLPTTLVATLLCVCTATAADRTSGVTIITHGFETGTFPAWPANMATAIQHRIGVPLPIYRLKYHLLSQSVSVETGPSADIDLVQDGGAIILL